MASTPLSARAIILGGSPAHLRGAALNQKKLVPLSCRCSSSPPEAAAHTDRESRRSSRRSASIGLLILIQSISAHPDSAVANPFDKYVKRKKLEPLEAYIPAVLLTQEQFKDLDKTLDVEQPKYDIGRSFLRSGPAASLRVNIRAVAQYATDDGKGQTASDAVDRCLRALEDLDALLLQASRNNPTASVKSMKSKINIALGALDSLLRTVPAPVLDKGKAIADAYMMPSEENEQQNSATLDPDLKQLESLL